MLKDAITSGNVGVFNQLNDLVQQRTVIKKQEEEEEDHAPVEYFDLLDFRWHGQLHSR